MVGKKTAAARYSEKREKKKTLIKRRIRRAPGGARRWDPAPHSLLFGLEYSAGRLGPAVLALGLGASVPPAWAGGGALGFIPLRIIVFRVIAGSNKRGYISE